MFQIWIDNRNGDEAVDYAHYVAPGSIVVDDKINLPTQITMVLNNVDDAFVVPVREAYVRIYSTKYGRVLATGFVSQIPAQSFNGLSSKTPSTGWKSFSYTITITSDDYLLNAKSFEFFPAQTGMGSGQLLAMMANKLAPGFFDCTMDSVTGDLIPYFQYDPTQTWGQYAKTFADNYRYRVGIRNKRMFFAPYGDEPLGIAYDETQPQRTFKTSGLNTSLMNTPLVNDAIVIGAEEPGNMHEDYFVGDGFTGNFGLRHLLFEGISTDLINESWTESEINTQNWTVVDPTDSFFMAGTLNVVAGPGTDYGLSYIVYNSAIEMAGKLTIEHGEVLPIDTTTALIGGVYSRLEAKLPTVNLIHNASNFQTESWTATGGNPPTIYEDGVVAYPNGPSYISQLVGPVATFGTDFNISFSAQTVSGAGGGLGILILDPSNGQVLIDATASVSGSLAFFSFSGSFPIGLGAQFPIPGSDLLVLIGNNLIDTAKTVKFSGLQLEYSSFATPFVDTADESNWAMTDVFLPYANCVAGFDLRDGPTGVTPSVSGASGVGIQPVYNGSLVGSPVYTQENHNYVVRTIFSCYNQSRYNTVYRTLAGTPYGGDNLDAYGDITWVIDDLDLTFPWANPQEIRFAIRNVKLPSFVLYAPVNNKNSNMTLSYTSAYLPPQGSTQLSSFYAFVNAQAMAPLSGWPWPPFPDQIDSLPVMDYEMGFGIYGPIASITNGTGGDTSELAFYSNNIPSLGARIHFESWEAQAAVARVQNLSSITAQAAVVGDDGDRLTVFTSLNPLPRSSEECELAGAQAIADRVLPVYNGSYSVEHTFFNFVNNDYPRSGRILNINAPDRGINYQDFVVNEVQTTITELWDEQLMVVLTFAPSKYLQTTLQSFLPPPTGVLTATDTLNPPTPVQLENIGSAFAKDLDNCKLGNGPLDPSWSVTGFDSLGSGSLSYGTYWVILTQINAGGETAPSEEFAVTLAIGNSIEVALLSLIQECTAVRAYVTNVGPGMEEFYIDCDPLAPTFITAYPTNPGTPPATVTNIGFDSSLAYCAVNDVDVSVVEVRRTDSGWGTNNRDLINRYSVQKFILPRLSFEQSWFLRGMAPGCTFGAVDSLGGGDFPHGTYKISMTLISAAGESAPSVEQEITLVAGNSFEITPNNPLGVPTLRFYITANNGLLGNETYFEDVPAAGTIFLTALPTFLGGPPPMLVSRRSKVIRIYAPLIPNPPILDPTQPINPDPYTSPGSIQFWFAENGDVRNVYGLEIRGSDNETVLLQRAIASPYDLIWTLDNTVTKDRTVTIFAYFINSLGEYSTTGIEVTVNIPQPPAPVLGLGGKLTTHIQLVLDQCDWPSGPFKDQVRGDIANTEIQWSKDPEFGDE